MRINRSLLNWGVFLIALGGIPLAVDQGWIESGIAADLGQLWPLILVGIGLGLILRWTPFAWFGGALVAATFGIIFGAAIVSVPDDEIASLQGIIPAVAADACTGDAGPGSTSAGGVAHRDVFELSASLSCGELTVGRAAGATWGLEAAHATDDVPRIDESDFDGATAHVGLSQSGHDDLGFLGSQPQSDWRVQVPAGSAITLATTLNAAKGDIDLGAGPVSAVEGTFNAADVAFDLADATTPERATVRLTLNASTGRLSLPDGDMSVDANLNASSLAVCVPAGAALRVEPSAILSSDDLRSSGLEEADSSSWTTPGFSTVGDYIELSIDSVVSSLSIDRPEACS